jgi:hypothetical protein
MRNIKTLPADVKCIECKKGGYFVYVEDNWATARTCPCCGRGDIVGGSDGRFQSGEKPYVCFQKMFDRDYPELVKDGKIRKFYDEKVHYLRKTYFCPYCKILYYEGCVHAENGCSASVYNGHFVKKWSWRGEVYNGMPQFDSINEWYNEIKNVEVMEVGCGNNGLHCEYGFYPKSENPDCYEECEYADNI